MFELDLTQHIYYRHKDDLIPDIKLHVEDNFIFISGYVFGISDILLLTPIKINSSLTNESVYISIFLVGGIVLDVGYSVSDLSDDRFRINVIEFRSEIIGAMSSKRTKTLDIH